MKKETNFHIRIPNEIYSKLRKLSEERGVAQKWLIVSALEEFLGTEKEIAADELKKELFEVKRRITALRGDVEVLGELFSFYIFHWLGYTPRLDKAERATLVVEARERHEKFMRLFAKKLSAGELSMGALFIKSLQEVVEDEDDEGPMEQAANED
jgi:predicted transcriptional regulator